MNSSSFQHLYKSVYARRKTLLVFAFLFLLTIPYQNCSNSFDTTSGNNNNSSLGGGPGGGGPTTTLLPLAVIQQTCAQAIGKPVLNSLNQSSLTIQSALGLNNSGDKGSATITAVGDINITNPAVFNDGVYNCQNRVNLDLQCSVVTGDPSKPINLTQAIDPAGNNAVPGATNIGQLAGNTIQMGDCNTGFQLGQNTVTISNGGAGIRPSSTNNNNQYRCVSGSFWLRFNVRNSVTGVTDNSANRMSNYVYVPVTVQNTCWKEARLKAAVPFTANIGVGTRVAIDGNWAVVIAPTENSPTGVIETGSAYVYNFDGTNWILTQTIFNSQAQIKDNITSVALKGNNMVLGSAYQGGTGGVYLYQLSGSTWNQVGPVIGPSDPQAGQDFGFSVSLSGTTLAVGAPLYVTGSGAYAKAGAVYMYDVVGGGLSFKQMITGAGDGSNKGFGTSVSVNGTTLAVGAPQAKTKEYLAPGEVYIYQYAASNWTLNKKVTVANAAQLVAGSRFGTIVDLSGTKLAVGSPGFVVGGNANQGRVYYYANWSGNETRTFDGGTANENYGYSVALGSAGLVIGSVNGNAGSGKVDYFDYATYTRKVVTGTNTTPNNYFGVSVGINGLNVIVGASKKSDPNSSSGAAYLFGM